MKSRLLCSFLLLVCIGCGSSSSTTDPGGGDEGPPPADEWPYGTVVHASVDGFCSEFYSDQFIVLMQDWYDETGYGRTTFDWESSDWDDDIRIILPFDSGSIPSLPVTLTVLMGEENIPPPGRFCVRAYYDSPSGANGIFGLDGTITIHEMNFQERRFRGVFNFRVGALAFDYDTGSGWIQVGGSYYETRFSNGVFDYPYVTSGLSLENIAAPAKGK